MKVIQAWSKAANRGVHHQPHGNAPVKAEGTCRFQVDGRVHLLPDLLPGLEQNFRAWVASSWVQQPGCFFSGDTADGGEDSISGDGCRVAVNAIMVRNPSCLHCSSYP